MTPMLPLYIAAAILGVGVTVLDMIGLIGSHSDADSSSGGSHGDDADHGDSTGDGAAWDHDAAGAQNADAGAGSDVADTSGGDATGGDVAGADAPGEASAGEDAAGDTSADDAEDTAAGGQEPGVIVPFGEEGERTAGRRRGFRRSGRNRRSEDAESDSTKVPLVILAGMRSLVYFCIGFGIVGWYAVATGVGALLSLVWSVPVGLVSLGGARLLRRVLRRELNSEIHTSELLMESGVVIVSILRGELGRVRVKLGDVYVERFARAAGNNREIHVGTKITVTDISDECVFVEPVDGAELIAKE